MTDKCLTKSVNISLEIEWSFEKDFQVWSLNIGNTKRCSEDDEGLVFPEGMPSGHEILHTAFIYEREKNIGYIQKSSPPLHPSLC